MGGFHVIGYAIEAYALVLVLRALLSWFPISPGTAMFRVNEVLWKVTEPVLAPVRRVIQPVGGLDLSFLVVVIALQVVASIFFRL